MNFDTFKGCFSTARVNRYLLASDNSPIRSIALYKANLKVAQAFHPLLGILEVVLRNRINDVLTIHFKDVDWVINEKVGFMSDPSLRYVHKRSGEIKTNEFLKKEIANAEKRLRKTGTKITSGKIIAEQSFGFWTDLFETHHYKILLGKPIQIFHHLPSGVGRKEVSAELDKIRRFRNRIHHNEPVCFNGNTIDFTSTLIVYNSINDILN